MTDWYEFMCTSPQQFRNLFPKYANPDALWDARWTYPKMCGAARDSQKQWWHATSSMHNSMPPCLSQPVTGSRRAARQEPAEWGDGAGYGRFLRQLWQTIWYDLVIGFTPLKINMSNNWIFKWCVSFQEPCINLVIHFWSHVWLKYLRWLPCFCDFGGWGWLDDWVDAWKICWEIVAVRM